MVFNEILRKNLKIDDRAKPHGIGPPVRDKSEQDPGETSLVAVRSGKAVHSSSTVQSSGYSRAFARFIAFSDFIEATSYG